MIHARYVLTNDGLNAVLEKYYKAEYGRCPRTNCMDQPVLPAAASDTPNEDAVKVPCIARAVPRRIACSSSPPRKLPVPPCRPRKLPKPLGTAARFALAGLLPGVRRAVRVGVAARRRLLHHLAAAPAPHAVHRPAASAPPPHPTPPPQPPAAERWLCGVRSD